MQKRIIFNKVAKIMLRIINLKYTIHFSVIKLLLCKAVLRTEKKHGFVQNKVSKTQNDTLFHILIVCFCIHLPLGEFAGTNI